MNDKVIVVKPVKQIVFRLRLFGFELIIEREGYEETEVGHDLH